MLKLTGIIGDPVHHTLSPAMHNAVFRKMKLPFVYLPFHVRPGELENFIDQARQWKMAGFNVTIPHKEKIIPFLNFLSPEAGVIGAVNTVVRHQDKLWGYNTDAPGYLASLREEAGFDPKGKRIVILGAGGAARAILYALGTSGASHISLWNRTPARASSLIEEFRPILGNTTLKPVSPDFPFQEILPKTDLLINATSAGLEKNSSGQGIIDAIPLNILPQTAVVSDLVYRPPETRFLKMASRLHLKTVSGIEMLLHQGALAFHLWTRKKPDLRVMRKALLKKGKPIT